MTPLYGWYFSASGNRQCVISTINITEISPSRSRCPPRSNPDQKSGILERAIIALYMSGQYSVYPAPLLPAHRTVLLIRTVTNHHSHGTEGNSGRCTEGNDRDSEFSNRSYYSDLVETSGCGLQIYEPQINGISPLYHRYNRPPPLLLLLLLISWSGLPLAGGYVSRRPHG